MRALTANGLLSVWEQGRQRHVLDRALLLYSAAAPGDEPDTLADRPLGQRNAALLRLQAFWFGDALQACVDCPRCGERLEFALSVSALLRGAVDEATFVEVDGIRFRLPTTRDLARVANESNASAAMQGLLLALVATEGVHAEKALALASRIESALEAADPCTDFALELLCPGCGHGWRSVFDIASYLWEQIEARSRRLLDEVNLLARPYHWAEREILSLSETRRAAYLERVLV